MAQYYTDFSEWVGGGFFDDWTARWNATEDEYDVPEEDGEAFLQFAGDESTGRKAVSWDVVGTPADVEIFWEFEGFVDNTGGEQSDPRVAARGAGDAGSETARTAGHRWGSRQDYLSTYDNGSFEGHVRIDSTRSLQRRYHGRYRISGSTDSMSVRQSHWPDHDPVITEDIPIVNDAGWLGVFNFGREEHRVYRFGVGTNGDSAPTSYVGWVGGKAFDLTGAAEGALAVAIDISDPANPAVLDYTTVDDTAQFELDTSAATSQTHVVVEHFEGRFPHNHRSFPYIEVS